MLNKFDEYRLLIEDTARFSERRQKISSNYAMVNSLLIAAIGFLVKDVGGDGVWAFLLPMPLVLSGIAISIWWSQLILKYKALVGLRIEVLREMEDGLDGLEKIFHREDGLYPRDAAGKMIVGQGLNISDVEVKLPFLFIFLYALFGTGLILAIAIRLYCPST